MASMGDFLASTHKVEEMSAKAQVFSYKGGGQIIAYFATFTDSWLSVDRVREVVELQGIKVHRDTIRDALNALTEMAFLEKHCSGTAPNSPVRYRRKLSEAAREDQARKRALGAMVKANGRASK